MFGLFKQKPSADEQAKALRKAANKYAASATVNAATQALLEMAFMEGAIYEAECEKGLRDR